MSNLSKLEFAPLESTGKNYMPWVINVKMNLKSMGILETINENNTCSSKEQATACVFIRKHIDDSLKYDYLTIEDPNVLWEDIKNRFDNQREILLPAAREEWRTLRFQDFKKVNEYSSALFRICSQLKFCGQEISDADMLEKTFSTMHASNILLQQNLRLQKFTKYSELNAYLLVAEKNNELLMKNQQSRPTGALAFPEANATNNNKRGRGRGQGRGYNGQYNQHGNYHNNGKNHNYGRSYPYGNGRGRGRSGGRSRGGGQRNNDTQKYKFQPLNKPTKQEVEGNSSKNPEDSCYRCGSVGHWSRTCRTPQHLVKLYKESLKGKEKEVNLVDDLDFTNTEPTSDFFNDLDL